MSLVNLLLWTFFGLASAQAQQVTCATRPAGDNSNACASTAFVHNGFIPATGFTVGLPLIGAPGGGITQGTVSGTTTKFSVVDGTPTTGQCAAWDSSGGLVSQSCATSAGTVQLTDYCSAALLATPNGDITSCLNTALTAAESLGYCLIMPNSLTAGQWAISSTINLGNGSAGTPSTINNICIQGSGSAAFYGTYGTSLKWTGSSGGTMFLVNGPINNVYLSRFNLLGNNLAGDGLELSSVRFSNLANLFIEGTNNVGLAVQGLAAAGDLNFMMIWDDLYVVPNPASGTAVGINFDGVFADNTDTWLTSIRNVRVDALGQGQTAWRFAFSDNILLEQIHAVDSISTTGTTNGSTTITAIPSTIGMAINNPVVGPNIPVGTVVSSIDSSSQIHISNAATGSASGQFLKVVTGCGVALDGTNNSGFPTGLHFVKSAIDNTCVTGTIGINTFDNFGTTDFEIIPTSEQLQGITDQGYTFNGYGRAPSYLVATVPSCTASVIGFRVYITNSAQTLAANIGSVLSGTGANVTPFGCDGTNWRVGS